MGVTFEIFSFPNGEALLKEYPGRLDLLLLDIAMPKVDGLTAARRIRRDDPDVVILFISSVTQYAVQGYSVEALDFIVKPVSYMGLKIRLDRALARIRQSRPRMIEVRNADGLFKLSAMDILYVETFRHRIVIHTRERALPAEKSMQSFEKELSGLPVILLLWVLEYGILRLLLRFLPPLGRIRMTGYTLTMTIAAVIPFLCIRSLSSAMQLLENKSFQIMTASCFLVELVTLARGIGVETGERERLRALELRRVLDTQQQQFHLKMQHIDDVNRKYHDMKNILLVLESGAATDDMRAGVRRLIGDIRPYETLVETGNGALDIVLSDKLRACQQEEIRCVPYVDGRMLDFVDPLDLCTIFGNALDNAIESCRQQENPENRQISIRTVSRGTAVVLVFRNTFAMRPVLRDGLPVSTKADKANHGYGLRNIRYVMERYGGEISCRVSGEEFVLTLLFLRESGAAND